MLDPNQLQQSISQIQQSNPQTPNTPGAKNTSLEQLQAGTQQPQSQPSKPGFMSGALNGGIGEAAPAIGKAAISFGQGIANDTNAHAANIVQDLSGKPSFTGALDVTGNIAGEVGDFFGEGLKAITPQPIKDALSKTAQSVAGTPGAQEMIKAWNGFQTQHPDVAKNIGNVVNIAALFGGGEAAKGAQAGAEAAGGAIKSGLETAGGAIKQTAQSLAENAGRNAAEKLATSKDSFIKDLITPQMTAKDLTGAIKTGKVAEGGGLTGTRDITKAIPGFDKVSQAVKEVPGISPKNTLLENANAIHDHIGTVAEDLKSQLSNSTFKGFSPTQFDGYMSKVKQSLAENPLITGDAEKSADKILTKFNSLVSDKGYTPNGLLDARKALDTWMSAQKGSSVFDPAKESAISTALRAIRQGGNDFLSKLAPDVPVKDMLAKQSNLYDAIENIAPKAAKEGATGLKQWIKAHPKLIKGLEYGAGAIGAGEVIKHTGLLP